MSDRIRCINLNCRRTAPATKYEPGAEIICGKCFKALPIDLQADHRKIWRDIRKWQRRITRTSDEIKIGRLNDLIGKLSFRLDMNWIHIKAAVNAADKPQGIEAFLKENGLG